MPASSADLYLMQLKKMTIYIYLSNEESTCVIYYKVFAYEINHNKLDVNILKTFVIDLLYNRFFCRFIRFMHQRIIIQKILDDTSKSVPNASRMDHLWRPGLYPDFICSPAYVGN